MIVIDVEASGLDPQSYPIEIAWQDSENEANFDSFLIVPHPSWVHWDMYAEQKIHGITRRLLADEGILPQDACARLNRELTGKTVYSDAVNFDQSWITTLFQVIGMTTSFELSSIQGTLPEGGELQYKNLFEASTVKHRALDDVRQIIGWVNKICDTDAKKSSFKGMH
ncbi:hypothetical protein [Litoribacillus peritrichatus]|uniref:Exonuclease domain-containing protein n=1 Tax=Litoribacillus peritrichatus TaxID=718191 RepID=A0ABP7N4N6_9GAMM